MAEYVSKHRIANLNVFASTVWGNAEAVLKQGNPIGVDYVDITQYMDAFEFLLGPAIPYYRKILIREEYRIALDALETKLAYRQAAYVTGQPGIGKSQVTFLEALESSLCVLDFSLQGRHFSLPMCLLHVSRSDVQLSGSLQMVPHSMSCSEIQQHSAPLLTQHHWMSMALCGLSRTQMQEFRVPTPSFMVSQVLSKQSKVPHPSRVAGSGASMLKLSAMLWIFGLNWRSQTLRE